MRKTTTSAPRLVRPPVDLEALVAAVDPEEIEEGSLRAGEIEALCESIHELTGCTTDGANDQRVAFLLEVLQRIAAEENERLSEIAGKLRRIVSPPLIDDKEWARIKGKAARDNARALAALAKRKRK